MGREIKRVPVDFRWPLNKVWGGFINPNHKPCPEENKTCFRGMSAAGMWFDAIVRFLTMVGENGAENQPGHSEAERARGCLFPHPYLTEFPQAPTTGYATEVVKNADAMFPEEFQRQMKWQYIQRNSPIKVIEPDAGCAEMIRALAGFDKPLQGGLFGTYNGLQSAFYKRFQRMMKLPKGWDQCSVCKGENIHPDAKEAYDAWKETPIPTGEGWQMWETVSEGSPVTPVFPTAEGLVEHLVSEMGHTRKAAEAFCVDGGWVPSMMIVGNQMTSNVEIAGLDK